MSRHSARLSHTRQSAARSRHARVGESFTIARLLRYAGKAVPEFRLNATSQLNQPKAKFPPAARGHAHRLGRVGVLRQRSEDSDSRFSRWANMRGGNLRVAWRPFQPRRARWQRMYVLDT